jgi:DNA-directed RNA polymerase subunit RPC12/RpoP
MSNSLQEVSNAIKPVPGPSNFPFFQYEPDICYGSKIVLMIKPYECTQCGSTNFEEVAAKRMRCAHCGSLFQVLTGEPSVVINKGANVIFGKNANVEIRGDIEVQNGATVDIQGKVTVLKGNKQQAFNLKLLRAGKNNPNNTNK